LRYQGIKSRGGVKLHIKPVPRMEGHGIMKDHGRSAVSVKENNLIPLRATSIKDENAGGIFILKG